MRENKDVYTEQEEKEAMMMAEKIVKLLKYEDMERLFWIMKGMQMARSVEGE